MARPPRGGFRASDVRGTLGSLIKTTLAQAGVVRDVLERGAREGRSRLDEVRAGRRRADALAELGEVVLELIRRGEIDLDELPEVRDVVADLDALDAAGGARGGRDAWRRGDDDAPRDHDEAPWHDDPGAHDHGAHDHAAYDHDAYDRGAHDRGTADRARHAGGLGDVAIPRSRSRFDDRGSRGARRGSDDARDGTVASSRWSPPSGKSDAPRVWRPPASSDRSTPAQASPPAIPELPKPIAQAHRGGGIRFDDDDLADYMHPDDVPPKPARDE